MFVIYRYRDTLELASACLKKNIVQLGNIVMLKQKQRLFLSHREGKSDIMNILFLDSLEM